MVGRGGAGVLVDFVADFAWKVEDVEGTFRSCVVVVTCHVEDNRYIYGVGEQGCAQLAQLRTSEKSRS